MTRRIALLCLLGAAAAGAALAQNQAPGEALVITPDGTLVSGTTGGPVYRWFATVLEGGKSYAVEAWNNSDGASTNRVQLDLYESNGSTDFFVANTGACGLSAVAAPSLSGNLTGNPDGARCLIYPALDNAAVTRVLKIRVRNPDQGDVPPGNPANGNTCINCTFRLRVRETTISSRWSVNGYNMFVALHNESVVPLAGVVLYYADAPAGPAEMVASDFFTLQKMASTQFVRNSLTLNPNHGSIRILIYGTGIYGGIEAGVQTYAFSTTANNFNVFIPSRPNHGGANSIGLNN